LASTESNPADFGTICGADASKVAIQITTLCGSNTATAMSAFEAYCAAYGHPVCEFCFYTMVCTSLIELEALADASSTGVSMASSTVVTTVAVTSGVATTAIITSTATVTSTTGATVPTSAGAPKAKVEAFAALVVAAAGLFTFY